MGVEVGVGRWIYGMAGAIIGLGIIWQALFAHHDHVYYWYHRVPGFDALLGLAGTLALIWVSKMLGERVVQRHESYYLGREPEARTEEERRE